MRVLTFLLALVFAMPTLAQRPKNKSGEIVPVTTFGGISYSLPRTGIRIVVEASLTSTMPGPYAAYADPLLGIKGVKTEPAIHWEMKHISVETFAEPDPEQVFKTAALRASMVQLTSDGCLAGINSQAPVAAPRMPATNSLVVENSTSKILFTNQTGNLNHSGRTPADQRAAEAAAKILKSRSGRYDIAAGYLDEFHPDGKAYEESLEELRRIEKENLELFTGKSKSSDYTFHFDFFPTAKTVKNEVVFRFDENRGFLPASDFSGIPVMVTLERTTSGPAAEASFTGDSGIYYRQPETVLLTLMRELDVIATARVPVAQYGTVVPVPAELLGGGYVIEFHPETGGLKSITQK